MGYSYEQVKNILSFAVSFDPSSAFPLDLRSMFGSYNDALAAAMSAKPAGSADSKYYYGQRLTVVENDIVSTYLIQTDNTLKAIGANVFGDEKTITLGEDGTLSLKSFGKQYYTYIPADVMIGEFASSDELPSANNGEYALVNGTYYKYNGSTWDAMGNDFVIKNVSSYQLTEGWKAGLEPKVITSADSTGFEIAWYEPSSTTVEGLNSVISTINTELNTVKESISTEIQNRSDALTAESTAREEADNALAQRINSNETNINTIKADASTEGSIKYEIAQALSALLENDNESLNSLKELVDWAENHAADAVTMNNNITANATAISAINGLLGTNLPETAVATNVIDYIAEVVSAEKTRAEAAEKALSDRLNSVESTTGNLGTAANKNVEYFATAEQGAKADSAVQSVVSGDNGYVNVDGSQVKAYELPKAKINELGGIKPDGSSITTDDNGVASVSAVDHTKVTGLGTELENTKTSAVSEANTYTDTNAIAKNDVVTSDNVSESIDTASVSKVVSEELLLSMLTWKEGM